MSSEGRPPSPPICDYEGSDYQDRFWDRGGRAYEDRVEAIALRSLLPPGGQLLLEIGAGAGRNTPRYRGFERVALLDYSLTQLQQAQTRLSGRSHLLFVVGDAYRLPFVGGLFDAATMIRTLHHLVAPERALQEIYQALRPRGVFLLEYANKRNLKAIVRYWLRAQDWNPFSHEPVEFAALNFDFHPAAVRRWLREAGFRVERQRTVSHFRMESAKRWIPLQLLVAMDAALQWTGDLWQLSPSVFVRARADAENAPAPAGAFFRCPESGHPIPHDPFRGEPPSVLRCPGCGLRWAVRDGIYDFKHPA